MENIKDGNVRTCCSSSFSANSAIFRGELKTRSGRVIKINKKIKCRTSNVVYAVHCKKCKHIVYVGETETMLKDRIQSHLSLKIKLCVI
jgi:hypothetical protein